MILEELKFKKIEFGTVAYKNLITFRFFNLRKPLKLEWSKDDLKHENKQLHFAIYYNEEIIGCCVLKKINKNKIRLRQMAVLDRYRGMNIGTLIIKKVEEFCLSTGISEIDITARCYAVGFYVKNGFSTYGDTFIDVTLESIKMKKILKNNSNI